MAGQRVTSEDKADLYLSALQAMEMVTDGMRLAASVAGQVASGRGTRWRGLYETSRCCGITPM